MSIKQYTAKKLLANIITINKKLLDMTLGLAEAFKGNTVGFIIGEVDSDVTELTNRVKQPVCVVEVTDAVAELRAQVERLTAERDALKATIERARERAESSANFIYGQLLSARKRAEAAEAERDSNKELYDSWYRKHLRKLEAVKAERDALQCQLDELSDNRNPRRNEKVRNQRRELDALGNSYRIVCKELDELSHEYWGVCAERDALKARIEEMDAHGDRDMLLAQWNKAAAERDALQARIDAGVRVWGKDLGNGEWCWSYTEYHTIDTHTAILIDPKPIDHLADPGKMVDDDRKNDTDRRVGFARGSCWRINQTADTRGKYRTAVPNTRRCTPGTKADRKHSWTRADGSTNPRTGDRRKS